MNVSYERWKEEETSYLPFARYAHGRQSCVSDHENIMQSVGMEEYI